MEFTKEEHKKIRELIDKINILGKELNNIDSRLIDELFIRSSYDRKTSGQILFTDSMQKLVYEEDD